MNIIGLAGLAGSGKDTVAKLIAKHTPNNECVIRSFAEPLKKFCQEVFQFSNKQLYGASEYRDEPDYRYPRKGGHLTPRYALQRLGTEWGRDCYESIWTEMGMREAKKLLQVRRGPVVFTDVRFVTEAKAINDAGGQVWFIDRASLLPKPTLMDKLLLRDPARRLHGSERELLSCQFQNHVTCVVDNNSDLEDLDEHVQDIMSLCKIVSLSRYASKG